MDLACHNKLALILSICNYIYDLTFYFTSLAEEFKTILNESFKATTRNKLTSDITKY